MSNNELENLRTEVLQCTKCDLAGTRNRVIFGEGNPRAKIILIGEAPGKDEDLQGRPFVGKSGQLLDKILLACGFERQQHIFISNIIKCRPPDNRVPREDEARICIPYLYRQIELIQPAMLVLLGATALKYMMGDAVRITRVRGSWLKWNDLPVMPVYHPSALLRNPSLKRDTWEDFKKIIFKYRELVDPQHHSPYV
jgi:uracil-DNA glycosylase family 4